LWWCSHFSGTTRPQSTPCGGLKLGALRQRQPCSTPLSSQLVNLQQRQRKTTPAPRSRVGILGPAAHDEAHWDSGRWQPGSASIQHLCDETRVIGRMAPAHDPCAGSVSATAASAPPCPTGAVTVAAGKFQSGANGRLSGIARIQLTHHLRHWNRQRLMPTACTIRTLQQTAPHYST
jgi:hypothetical protein